MRLVLLIFILCCSCKPKPSLSVDLSDDIVVPKHYIVTKAQNELIIDGKADEPSWKNAVFTDNFIDIEGIKQPKYNTKIKMLWNDNYLYVYSEMEEPHIWATLKQRDTIIYYNNDFEVFIDPSGKAQDYGEIEINALNTVWDLYLDKPYRTGGKAYFNWNLDSLKTAVQIYGSLNNPSDIDSLWTIEMAIPLKPIMALKNDSEAKPRDDEQWRINFSRVEWEHDIIDGRYERKKENGKHMKEYNWVWSNQKVINMHQPETWGFLQFTSAQSSKHINFIEDKDLLVKQVAFALFRNTRLGNLKHLLENPVGSKQIVNVTYDTNLTLNAEFHKTQHGFEYILKTQNVNYNINQNGLLTTL